MAERSINRQASCEELHVYSRKMIEEGSKSFARAAALMPADIRTSVFMLYAWCRHCDDVIDDQHLGFPIERQHCRSDIKSRVASLREKTRKAYLGEAEEPPFQALSRVARHHQIPERFALDLIDGFAMDASGKFYATEDDMLRYCYHVAGAVGVMMAMVMGVRDRPTLLRACDLGLAFQLTNISRDVIADAKVGRVYLPKTWLDEAGLSIEALANQEQREKLFAVVTRTLGTADNYYDSAKCGIAKLPFRCAWSITSALRIYRAIGGEIRQAGAMAWDHRATTNRRQKLQHIALAAGDVVADMRLSRDRPTTEREGLWTPPALSFETVGHDTGVDGLVRLSA